MFSRAHHQRIHKILHLLNGEFLESVGCYFAGGTAIVLQLGEYRESVDVDFMCSSTEGFRALRNTVTPEALGEISRGGLILAREVISDQYGIRTRIEVDGVPVKFEIIQEARICVSGAYSPVFQVPVISHGDAQAEKLLANADRGADSSTHFRDLIDLAFSIDAWGWPADATWEKVGRAYGEHVIRSFEIARHKISQEGALNTALGSLGISVDHKDRLSNALRLPIIEDRGGAPVPQ